MKRRKTGGRKKGSKNKRTVELEKKAAEGQTPLDYMLQVMRDVKADDARRDEMARAAAPYLHARRAPEDKHGKTVPAMIYTTPNLESSDE
jgi:hypothetical protein